MKLFMEDANEIKTEGNIGITRGWKCCKCGEEMYRGESKCNGSYCGHYHCSGCKSFQD